MSRSLSLLRRCPSILLRHPKSILLIGLLGAVALVSSGSVHAPEGPAAAGMHPRGATPGGDAPGGEPGRDYELTAATAADAAAEPGGWVGRNRAQGFRTLFGDERIRVRPEAGPAEWELSLRLSGFGPAGAVTEAEPGAMRARGNRAEVDKGALTEWYVNDARGLEQGFTVWYRPGEETGGRDLVIELELGGDLLVMMDGDGRTVNLYRPGDRLATLRYGEARAEDAAGRELPVGIELRPGREPDGETDSDPDAGQAGKAVASGVLRLVVDATDAEYPIEVDPLLSAAAWSSVGTTDDDYSVAWGDWDGDGDLDLAVGSNGVNRVYENEAGTLDCDPNGGLGWISSDSQSTRSLAWGDWDGDGDLDLAAGNLGQKNRVYENDSGTLDCDPNGSGLGWISSESEETHSVAWGDWDGDGDLDLAVGNNGLNRVHENTGSGLDQGSVWTSGDSQSTRSLAWGDWDGDGDLDLAAGNLSQKNRVYESDAGTLHCDPNGSGLGWISSESEESYSVAWGDWDGDGDLDLAVGNGADRVRVYENTGGTLSSVWRSSESQDIRSVAWGDWDGDGDLDLAAGGYGYNRVYENTGAGLDPNSAVWSSSDSQDTLSVAWGDWDNDGDLDLAAGNYDQQDRVYENRGGVLGSVAAWSSSGSDNTYGFAWGDWDGDGDLDLAVGNYGQANRVYENEGGTLDCDPNIGLGWVSSESENSVSVAWGDWDGDGDLDLAVGNYGQANRVYENEGGTLECDPNGSGLGWISSDPDDTYGVAWGDWDGDGDLDLAVANSGLSRVYENTGAGLDPNVAVWTASTTQDARSAAWGDWDDDGDLDLAVGGYGPNRVYENTGAGLDPNSVAWSSSESESSLSVAWGDWDGDGDLDLAVGNYGQANRVYENTGGYLDCDPNIGLGWVSSESDNTLSVAWGDWDGDGDLDLAAGNRNQPNRVYENTGAGLDPNAVWSSSESDDTWPVAWGDWDNDGDLDLAAGSRNQPNRLYENGRLGLAGGLPESPVHPVVALRPGITDSGFFFSSAEVLSAASGITIHYELFDAQSDPAQQIVAEYSVNGGGQWFLATEGLGGDGTTDLAADPNGAPHVYSWDAATDAVDSDNVLFRITVLWQAPDHAGSPILHGALSATTPPFRVRTSCTDADGDGICAATDCDDTEANCTTDCTDGDGDGVYVCAGDCDDEVAAIYPAAPQICDGLNNDCDHPSWPGLGNTNEADDDGDTLSECAGDCDDAAVTVYPAATQICDGLNNDCDHPSWPGLANTNENDDDGDTLSECVGDCDDGVATVYPGAPQICDGLNNDCDHPSWPGLGNTNEADDDGDTYTECAGDCDDAAVTVYPAATQICDGLNNDCDHPAWPGLSDTNDGDDDGDMLSECAGDCDDARAGCTTDCTDGDGDGVRGCDGDCDDGVAICTTDCTDGDADGYCATTPLHPLAAWSSDEAESTWGTAWGDWDGDGDLDLAVGNYNQPNRVYENRGTGLDPNAVWTSSESGSTYGVAWGDRDGDGDLDLAVADAGVIRVYGNTGLNGGLDPNAVWTSSGSLQARSVAWGDWDGDGDLDLAVGGYGPNYVYENNDINGGLDPNSVAWTSSDSESTLSVAWGDWDGDGDLDLAVGNYDQPNRVYENTGLNGGLDPNSAAWESSDSESTLSVAWGDWDGDGDLDLAVGNSNNQANRVYHNVGLNGGLDPNAAWTSEGTRSTYSVAWGDWDGDGDLDLAVGNSNNQANSVYENTGTGLDPGIAWSSSESDDSRGVAWVDWDGDGDLDLAAGNYAQPNRVYENWTSEGLTTDCDDTEAGCTTDCTDGDGDGVYVCAGDCDDAEAGVYPGAQQVCGDGLNNDCDHPSWPGLLSTNETDDDGDTLSECAGDCDDGNANCTTDCTDGDGDGVYVCAGDCDDGNANCTTDCTNLDSDAYCVTTDCDDAVGAVYPGAPQICDGLNNDCDHPSWPGLSGTNDGDDDGDTYSECGGDCNDTVGSVYPAAPQICDGLNNDCDHPSWPGLLSTNETDDDGDTLSECAGDCDDGNASCAADCTDGDGDGVYVCAGDCDDGNANCTTNCTDDDADGYCETDPLLAYAAWTSADTENTMSVAWGDWDGDGDLDMAAGNYNQPNRLYENTGLGLVPDAVWASVEEENTYSVAWGDCGGQVLFVGNDGETNRFYRESGGSWVGYVFSLLDVDNTRSVAWGDWDGDGDMDLAVGNYGQPNRVYECSGSGSLDHHAAWSDVESEYTYSVAWGDWDGDGDMDLAVGNGSNTEPNRVYQSTGGSLELAWTSSEKRGTRSVAWGDWDGDGDLDLAVGNEGQQNLVYENTGGTPPLSEVAGWASADSDNTRSVAWGDWDGDGDQDLAEGNGGQANRVNENWTSVGLTADCDDVAGTVYPGAPQICDGLNNDCGHPSWPGLANTNEADHDGDTVSECAGDCDDAVATVYPAAPQTCDGLNNDCGHPSWPGLANTNEVDDDGDTYSECDGDCDDSDSQNWFVPGEVVDLEFQADGQTLTWVPPAAPGCTSPVYISRRSEMADDFVTSLECLEVGVHLDTQAVDSEDPPPGVVYFYLVSAADACGLGTAGWSSSAERPLPVEACDGVDNDCDGTTDDTLGAVGCSDYFLDADGDTWTVGGSAGCSCQPPDPPASYTTTYNPEDCYDANASAHPGQLAWFTTHRGDGSFDYDCDGYETRRYGTRTCTESGGSSCSSQSGFVPPVPSCGQSGSFQVDCVFGGIVGCVPVTETRTQECR